MTATLIPHFPSFSISSSMTSSHTPILPAVHVVFYGLCTAAVHLHAVPWWMRNTRRSGCERGPAQARRPRLRDRRAMHDEGVLHVDLYYCTSI